MASQDYKMQGKKGLFDKLLNLLNRESRISMFVLLKLHLRLQV